jgi:hypothetical protein
VVVAELLDVRSPPQPAIASTAASDSAPPTTHDDLTLQHDIVLNAYSKNGTGISIVG